MRHLASTLAIAASLAIQAGCADPGRIVQPSAAPLASRASTQAGDDGVRRVEMLDACDPTSFDAVLGAGTCLRAGGVTFEQFIALLTKHGDIGAWRFAPQELEVRVGQTLLAINRGGEVHTFTEVEHFGGGIVPVLNTLSGNTVVAPECQQLGAGDFVPPGGTHADDVDEAGTEYYQCCIHPWMRTTVHARGS